MLAQIRAFAKTPFAGALMAVLVASFAIWGIRDVFKTGGIKSGVVQAGSRSIDAAEFRRDFDNFKKQAEQQAKGQTITLEDLLAANYDVRLAEELSHQAALNEMIKREGLRPSDKFVIDQIRAAKQFFSPVTGQFDEKAYKAFLAQNGITAEDLEGEIRDGIAGNHLKSGIAAGLNAPLVYAALESAYGLEARSAKYLVLTPAQVPKPTLPTDDQIRAVMKARAAELVKPETRIITVALFSASRIAPTVTIDPAKVQKRFDFEKDTLSQPETRSLAQLVVKSQAQAVEAAKQLQTGADPDAVAKALGVAPPLHLTHEPKTHIADLKVADAAFSLPAGAISGPIQGQLGWAVVKVTDIVPGHQVTLAEVKSRIENEVRKAEASDAAYELSKKYDEVHSGGANLIDAAKKVGAPILELPPVTKDGRGANGQQLQLPPKMLQAAYALAKGGETEGVEEAAPGEYYAIRVTDVIPQAAPSFEEVRGPIAQRLMIDNLKAALQAKADAVMEQLKKGETLDAAAKSLGVQVASVDNLTRQSPQASQALGQVFVGALFAAKRGDYVSAYTQTGLAIIQATAITPAPADVLAKQIAARRPQLAHALDQDAGSALQLAAQALIKPKVDLAQARAAVGGDPATLKVQNPGAPAKTASPAP